MSVSVVAHQYLVIVVSAFGSILASHQEPRNALSSDQIHGEVSMIIRKEMASDHDIESGDNIGSESSMPFSNSSTLRFDQEPFETFQHKVAALCEELEFGTPCVIEHMTGGSFNRIIGLRFATLRRRSRLLKSLGILKACVCWLIRCNPTATGQRLILRIPRKHRDALEKAAEIKDQVCVLQELAHHFPVARVIAYDTSRKNAIGAPWVLQNRLEGHPLNYVYPIMDVQTRKEIVALVAGAIANMERITFNRHGQFVAPRSMPDRLLDAEKLNVCPELADIKLKGGEAILDDGNLSVYGFLSKLLESQQQKEEKKGIEGYDLVENWMQLAEILKDMKDAGILTDVSSVLWHWDFAARNILVKKIRGKWQITGIVDWDGAMAVPKVIARKPPAWMWHHSEPSGWSWTGGLDFQLVRPLTADEAEVKRQFDDLIEKLLPGYKEDAYGPGRWVRRLARFAIYGFGCAEDWQRCETFIREWRKEKRRSIRTSLPLQTTL